MIAACIILGLTAAIAWAAVVLDLGRRLIRHADAVEERRRLAMEALDVAAIERRLVKLETAERQTATVFAGRR